MPLRVVLDEDVSHDLAGALRSIGHDAHSAKELGHLGYSDVRVLTRAADLGRLPVTHNKKYMLLLREAWLAWRSRWEASSHELADHPGILLVPHLPVPDLARIVEEFAGLEVDPTNRAFAWNPREGWHELTM